MSRNFHHVINSRFSLKAHLFLSIQARRNHPFWRDNLRHLNGVLFWLPPPLLPSKTVLSEASTTGCLAFIQASTAIFHRNWTKKCSNWRGLATVKFTSEVSLEQLSASGVRWNTDSRNIATVVQAGSIIQELQDLALGIY